MAWPPQQQAVSCGTTATAPSFPSETSPRWRAPRVGSPATRRLPRLWATARLDVARFNHSGMADAFEAAVEHAIATRSSGRTSG
jgi:hypothetical protein